MLAPEIAVATGLTQGCMPIGPVHRIDEARDNVIMAIDGRPALAVFYEDIGPELAQDPRRLGGLIFAGLPVAGSDTGDYLVRNLMAIDPGQGWVVLGAEVAAGDQILFCRRDPDSARTDISRMLRQLAGRLPGPPKAGVYVSCIARGAALFGEPGVETADDPRNSRRFPADRVFRQRRDFARPALRPYRRLDPVHLNAGAVASGGAMTCCASLSGSSFRRS